MVRITSKNRKTTAARNKVEDTANDAAIAQALAAELSAPRGALHMSATPPSMNPPPRTATSSMLSNTPAFTPSVPSKHMCLVPCLLGREGLCIEMMVDSGASSSVISMGLAQRLGLDGSINRTSGGVAYGVGTVNILGHIRNLPCVLGNVEFLIDFLVLDTTDNEMLLLGLDQMRKYKCIIDL